MMTNTYSLQPELVLGLRINNHVPEVDQKRQRAEVDEIIRRLRQQPGVILADEVGMGKTFVALAVAYSVAKRSPRGPVIVMVPANLIDKWEQDLKKFCELYLENHRAVHRETATREELNSSDVVRYGVARHSVELMKLLDDKPRYRCHFIFLAQGAMSRRQTDKWIRLALIAEALRRHGRGRADRLIQVKNKIHRFLAELLQAIGEQRATDWGEDLWQSLLRSDPSAWKDIYNTTVRIGDKQLKDDPVPKSVIRALQRIDDMSELAEALKKMPVRSRGGDTRVSERLVNTRKALRKVEDKLWKELLAQARWRSPLLVLDEAHHLKNPGVGLARQLQSPDSEQDLRTGDGAMSNAYDRMLFLTATPFQLGHHELVRVLERFGNVRWEENELGSQEEFHQRMRDLNVHLDKSQRTVIAFQQSWNRLHPEDVDREVDQWWDHLRQGSKESMTIRQRAVIDAYEVAKQCRDIVQTSLHPWIVRHNKGEYWVNTNINRRKRVVGAAIAGIDTEGGLSVLPEQLLPFFLAARSAVNPGQDLLGEALCSSYEAFRHTRQNRSVEKDAEDEPAVSIVDLSHAPWYLSEFDHALAQCSGSAHPKISATIKRVVDLWERGEKVLVFAFYRQTCRALRIHISQEIERRIMTVGQRRLSEAGHAGEKDKIDKLVEQIHDRYFDKLHSPGRRAVDSALGTIMKAHEKSLNRVRMTNQQREQLVDVMRRFLRVPTTLIRCFPISELDTIAHDVAIKRTLEHADESGITWRSKFDNFIEFVTDRCSDVERELYLDAAQQTQTGGIRVEHEEEEDSDTSVVTLANVQVAMGTTRRDTRARLMRAFNTPFFPDILICSQVMGEGVDLQRFCRHVIHHDLAWNPSTIEQRTGRIDRLGCKAEGRQPIVVYLPYLAGTADERQYRVVTDREQWFRIVMGQDEVAKLIKQDGESTFPLPSAITKELCFDGICQ